jgi:dihydrofolate synthase / folylpolyglutamate synthase
MNMDYQQTIDYLFTRLPMFSRIGAAAIKKDLINTRELCNYLDNPQNKFKSIHVAGTNGKGSTSHMLAAILQVAGYSTGLYTSPHLKDFRERIRVNGAMISKDFVVDFTEKTMEISERIEPSFFEMTVAMAFDYFAASEVDVAVIEVGLGGRLDSTNIIQPELSVITNIGWDHMNILGDTLQKIAAEKSGIIKPGIPVVVGESDPETLPVFEAAAANASSPLFVADKIRYSPEWKYEHTWFDITVADNRNDERNQYQLDLTGYYQLKNLITVLEAVELLRERGFRITNEHVAKALRQVKRLTGLHGRWELIRHHPDVVLDVAHNVEGIRQLVAQLELAGSNGVHVVIGIVKDKEIDEMLKLLPKEATYYFTKARIPRAMPEELLLEAGNKIGLNGLSYPDVNTALQAALSAADKDDLILVCGSVFVVGEVDTNAITFQSEKQKTKS